MALGDFGGGDRWGESYWNRPAERDPMRGLYDDPMAQINSSMMKGWEDYTTTVNGGQPGATGGNADAAKGLSVAGGAWAALDAHNTEIGNSAAKYGVPANLIKSMINRESSGNWEAYGSMVNSSVRPGKSILPFVGIFDDTAKEWGFDFNAMVGNKQMQIDAMAYGLAQLAKDYGGFENATKVYFGGPGALNGGTFVDELGMDSNTYGQKALDGWHELDSYGGGGWNGAPGEGGVAGANKVVETATSYVGVSYVWGAVPGKGADPRQTGWDCSGMTYWLDQNYGDGSLPAGSHYQFQDAVNKGQLKTDSNQLQAGDLVFFDTGLRGGGGANLNGASHVGVYMGGGKFVHAANPDAGTIISDLNQYMGMYEYLGAKSMSWSGGGSGVPSVAGATGGQTQQRPAGEWWRGLF